MYYYMYSSNIHTYVLSILLFDNFITSLINDHMVSMEFKFVISLEIFTWWQITIDDDKYISTTERMNISSAHQITFVCSLYVTTSICQLCVILT